MVATSAAIAGTLWWLAQALLDSVVATQIWSGGHLRRYDSCDLLVTTLWPEPCRGHAACREFPVSHALKGGSYGSGPLRTAVYGGHMRFSSGGHPIPYGRHPLVAAL